MHADSCRAIPTALAYITQTTLSVDDTAEIVRILKERFPAIVGPHKEDICYATTNRQAAVEADRPQMRLRHRRRCAQQLQFAAPGGGRARAPAAPRHCWSRAPATLPWEELGDLKTPRRHGRGVGSRGARRRNDRRVPRSAITVTVEPVKTAEERIAFNVPRELRDGAQG